MITSLVCLTSLACIINFVTATMISSGDTVKRNEFDHDAVAHKSLSLREDCGTFIGRALNLPFIDIYHIKRVLHGMHRDDAMEGSFLYRLGMVGNQRDRWLRCLAAILMTSKQGLHGSHLSCKNHVRAKQHRQLVESKNVMCIWLCAIP